MGRFIRAIVLTAVGFVVLFIVLAGLLGPKNTTTTNACGDKMGALLASEEIVSRRLKAPATASFPSIVDDGVTVLRLGKCDFRVKSYVDAQNSFGAKLRSIYTMNLTYSRDREAWRASNINIE